MTINKKEHKKEKIMCRLTFAEYGLKTTKDADGYVKKNQ
jgi:hypothetical protein